MPDCAVRGRHGEGDVGRFRGVLEDVRNLELPHGGVSPAAAVAADGGETGRRDVRADSGVGRGEPGAAAAGSAGDAGSGGRGGGRASESGYLVANAHGFCGYWPGLLQRPCVFFAGRF